MMQGRLQRIQDSDQAGFEAVKAGEIIDLLAARGS